MSVPYHHHTYQSSDLIPITELFSLCFNGLKLTPEYYTWRVLNTPGNKILVDLFKNDAGNIISHYAVCPVNSYYRGEEFQSVLSLITMTHPDYKSMGLFPKLASKLYQRSFEEEHIQLVYGFPNTNSHYSFIKKLQWNDVYMIPTMKKTMTQNLSWKQQSVEVFHADHRFDDLWKMVSTQSNRFFANSRTSTFINWRFFNRPDKKYRIFVLSNQNTISAYFVVKEYVNGQHKELDVVDMLIGYESDEPAVMESLLKLASDENAQAINMWIPYSTPFYHLAEKNGFIPREHITYLGYKPFNIKQDTQPLLISSNWYLTMCDSDVY
jgi:hypothetical protein